MRAIARVHGFFSDVHKTENNAWYIDRNRGWRNRWDWLSARKCPAFYERRSVNLIKTRICNVSSSLVHETCARCIYVLCANVRAINVTFDRVVPKAILRKDQGSSTPSTTLRDSWACMHRITLKIRVCTARNERTPQGPENFPSRVARNEQHRKTYTLISPARSISLTPPTSPSRAGALGCLQ